MHVVALAELKLPIEAEAAALAIDLDSAAYDERLNLNSGLPAVIVATADADKARALAAAITARGNRVLCLDASQLVAGDSMISLRRFALEKAALIASDKPDAELPFAEIASLIRATSRSTTESHATVKEKKFDVGLAIASGGLMLSKTTTRDVKTVRHQSDDVLYLFRRDGGTPWLLRAASTHYNALGDAIAPTARANFLQLVSLLRARAPSAIYDERLVSLRTPPERARRASLAIPALASSDDGANDLLSQLIARSLAKPAR